MADEKKAVPKTGASAVDAGGDVPAAGRAGDAVLVEMTQGPRKGKVVSMGRKQAAVVQASRRGKPASQEAIDRLSKTKK